MEGFEKEIFDFRLTALNEESWKKLSGKLMGVVDSLIAEINIEKGHSSDSLKNASEIAVSFLKAKMQRPTIENEKMLSEIMLNYANVKKIDKEAMKIDQEIIDSKINQLKELVTLFAQFREVYSHNDPSKNSRLVSIGLETLDDLK
ncbi:MAG: hypothetical protein CMP48_19930 [Rickettsiales bacterium]|nr:hypothetical protein [Rickettsiales bacterium]